MMSKRTVQYFLLIIILGVLLVSAFLVKTATWRLVLISALSLVYFLYGIAHHWEEKNLNGRIVLEFGAVGLLIFVVLYSLLVGQF